MEKQEASRRYSMPPASLPAGPVTWRTCMAGWPLYESPKTGMEIKLQHLEPGLMTTWHTHTCGHGMYVLAGKLHTSHGTFGPGDFVWFEAGTRMEHGTVDEPADLLFITDGPFDIAME